MSINTMTSSNGSDEDSLRTQQDELLTNETIAKARQVRSLYDNVQKSHEEQLTYANDMSSKRDESSQDVDHKHEQTHQRQEFSNIQQSESSKTSSLNDTRNIGPLGLNYMDLYNDYKSMVYCFEKQILRLICYAYYRHNGVPSVSIPKALEEFESDIEITQEINLTKERLEVEHLHSAGLRYELENARLSFQSRHWNAAQNSLEKIWKELCPLNLNELFRLVDQTDGAAKLINDKHVILFLGGTGTGKSTTIHFLGGSTLTEVEEFGLPHLKPIHITNPDLLNVTTSPTARSETRYMSAVRIDPNEMPELNEDEIVLCDSPGFEDTNGPEVDIANGIGIIRAIKGCKSVRPVVLMSYLSMGYRLSGVKDLAHLIIKLIPSIKSHMKAFSYIFTKYPDPSKAPVYKMLVDLKQQMTESEKQDLAFVSLISDMILKTRNSPLLLNPLKDDRINVFIELFRSNTIPKPGNVFQFSITEKSRSIVQEQVRKDESSIKNAMNRAEYDLVKYKLDQFKKLCDLIVQANITDIYLETIQTIENHLAKQYENAKEWIHHYFSDKSPYIDDDLSKYKEYYLNVVGADKLRDKHISNESVHSEAYISILKTEVETLVAKIKVSKLYDKIPKVDLDEFQVDIDKFRAYLDKMRVIQKLFPNLNTFSYTDARVLVQEKIENCFTSLKTDLQNCFTSPETDLENDPYEESVNSLIKLRCTCEHLVDHIDSQQVRRFYELMKESFLERMRKCNDASNEILSKEELTKDDIQLLSKWIDKLELVKNIKGFESCIPRRSFEMIYEELLSQILNYFDRLIKSTKEIVRKQIDFSTLEKRMSQLTLLKTIPFIELRNAQSYFSTLEAVIGAIHESRRDVENNVNTIFQGDGKVNYDKFLVSLKILKGAEWIESYRKDVYSNVIASLQKVVLQHVDRQVKDLLEIRLTLEDVANIHLIWKNLTELNKLKELDEFFPGIENPIVESLKKFQKQIDDVCDETIKHFDLNKLEIQPIENFDWIKADKSLNYLKTCRKHRLILSEKVIIAQAAIEDSIGKVVKQIDETMSSSFKNIQKYPNECTETLVETGRKLGKSLQGIHEARLQYTHVMEYSLMKEMIKTLQEKLTDFRNELEQNMDDFSKSTEMSQLQDKLAIAKALSKVDFFLDEKFLDLYTTYQKECIVNTNETSEKVLIAIKNRDYETVSIEMSVLKASGNLGKGLYDRAKRSLKIDVENLVEETKHQAIMIRNELSKEKIEPISASLKRLNRAEKFLSEHLEDISEVTSCISKVTKIVAYQIECAVNGAKALINAENVSEAERNIKSLGLVRDLLGRFCTEEASKLIDQIKTSQSTVVLVDIPERYADMDLQQYMIRPPTDIFNKFNEADATNPIYANALEKIRTSILEKFRSKLDAAKKLRPSNSDNIHIRQFESAMNFLPDGMKKLLDDELKYAKDEIRKSADAENKRFIVILQSQNPSLIKQDLKVYADSREREHYLIKIRDDVYLQVQDIVLKIEEALEKNNHARVFEFFLKLHEYKTQLEDDIESIRETFLQTKMKITKKFYESEECFSDRLLSNKSSETDDNVLFLIENSFCFIIEIIKFASSRETIKDNNGVFVSDLLPENFEVTVKEFTEKTIDFFKGLRDRVSAKLEYQSIASICTSLDTLYKWDKLFLRVRQTVQNYLSLKDSARAMKEAIESLPAYKYVLDDVKKKIGLLFESLKTQELINSETRDHQRNQRTKFYRELNNQMTTLYEIRTLDFHFQREALIKAFDDSCAHFTTKIKSLFENARTCLSSLFTEKDLNSRNFDTFNLNYENLLSFHTEIKVVDFQTFGYINQIEETVMGRFLSWQRDTIESQSISNIANTLIDMKRISIRIISLKEKLNKIIDETLLRLQRKFKGTNIFNKIGDQLNDDHVGASIVIEHAMFKGYSNSIFIEKTQKHDIDYVLSNIKGTNVNIKLLKERYDEFDKEYKLALKLYLKPELETTQLISNITTKTGSIKQEQGNIDWDAHINLIPELTANLFTLWSLQNAQYYFEATENEKRENFLFKPHAAQVIAIFRILGIGDEKETLKNNLVQIGTGEGKSIILGIVSTLLALFGFDVFCACYSEYLSNRDYNAFSSLFAAVGVVNQIHYGTFNHLCEDVINSRGNIRQLVEESILKNSIVTETTDEDSIRPKILLMDEVDVFFNAAFYGNVYTPCARVKDLAITELVNFIWQNRNSNLTLHKVKSTSVYKSCCDKFSLWVKLLDESIKNMIMDVTSFESHNYIVKEDKIGYVEQDRVAFNIFFGYKTLFAYYHECQKGQISQSALSEQISLYVECGHFSYAEIPLMFEFIFGVTGTLENLIHPEGKSIREDYRITRETYKIIQETFMPSVFGRNQLDFQEGRDIKIENIHDYFNTIMKEIENHLSGSSGGKRAVLVVFESRERLTEFQQSKPAMRWKDDFLVINEDKTATERDSFIKRATTSGQITLLTKTFGRGTDFVCHDSKVAQNGGVHVIQAFLSEESSEEKQIKGRTARQGEYGSYSMVLLDSDLEKFLIYTDDVEKLKRGEHFLSRVWKKLISRSEYKNVYEMIDDHRNIFFKRNYETNGHFVKDARKGHEDAIVFLENLLNQRIDEVQQFLVEQNIGPEYVAKSRTIVLMDATGSMASLLQNCKATVGVMFQRASDILREYNGCENTFQLQFAVYRNYNCKEDKILQSSPWETKADNLWMFLNTIKPEGGLGNEAIEIGFLHANKEHELQAISQVILIGDASPNTREEVPNKRNQFGQEYWANTRFATETYYETELDQLVEKGIPVHAFYVDTRAKNSFTEIAQKAQGRCEALHIGSPEKGAEMLTNLVTEEILRNVGGDAQGTVLVEAYRKKYSKSYA